MTPAEEVLLVKNYELERLRSDNARLKALCDFLFVLVEDATRRLKGQQPRFPTEKHLVDAMRRVKGGDDLYAVLHSSRSHSDKRARTA